MISPDIKDLMRDMDSRYTLVVTAAKRARQLTDGARAHTDFRSDKPVTLAIHEIAEGKVDYYRDAMYDDDPYAGVGHGLGTSPVGSANIFGSFGEPDDDEIGGRGRRFVQTGGYDGDSAEDADEAYDDAEADEFEDADGLYADDHEAEEPYEADDEAAGGGGFGLLSSYEEEESEAYPAADISDEDI